MQPKPMTPTVNLDFSMDMDAIMEELCNIETLVELDLSRPSDNTYNEPVFVQTTLKKDNKNIALF